MKRILRILLLIHSFLIINGSFAQQLSVEWSNKFGGVGWDYVNDLIKLENGSFILAGSKSLPITNDSTFTKRVVNAWIAQIDSSGNLAWEKYIYCKGFSTITSINEYNQNVFLSGLFQDTASFDSLSISTKAYTSAFNLVIDKNGNLIKFNKISHDCNAINIISSTSNSGIVYTALDFSEMLTIGSRQIKPLLFNSIVLSRLSDNSILSDAIEINCTGELELSDFISLDTSLLVSGSFSDSLFLPDSIVVSTEGEDAFIAEINQNGKLEWYKTITGRGAQKITDIAFLNGIIGVTGLFTGNSFFDSTVLQSFGNTDLFYSLIDSSHTFTLSNNIGGISVDKGYSIFLEEGHFYITGSFSHSIGIPDATGSQTNFLAFSPFGNSFIAKFNYLGSLKASYNLPGDCEDYCQKLIIDNNDKITVTGNFHGSISLVNSNYEVTTLTSSGDKDIFIFHFDDLCQDFMISAGPDTSICTNTSITLSSHDMISSYVWEPNGLLNSDIIISEPGTYRLTALNEVGCISIDSINVIENFLPVVFAGNDTVVDAGNNLELFATGEANLWEWQSNGTGYFGNSNSINTYYSPSIQDISQGGVILYLTGSNTCGSVSDSLILSVPFDEDGIIVYPNPSASQTTVVCEENQLIESITITTQSGLVLVSNQSVNSLSFDYSLFPYPPGTFIYYIKTNLGISTKIVNKI